MSLRRLSQVFLLITAVAMLFVTFSSAQIRPLPGPSRILEESLQKGFPSSRLYWDRVQLVGFAATPLRVEVAPPTRFTSFAVAWGILGDHPPAWAFSFQVRTRVRGGHWSPAVTLEGETAPDENPSGLYWSALYMTPDGSSHDEVEIVMRSPPSISLTSLQLMTAELLSVPPLPGPQPEAARAHEFAGNYPRPAIIPRSDWWGDLPPDSLYGHFGPIRIGISHAVVHHTAMTNNPPDPAQEIRNIWNLHVYGNGWSDIGYNFLIDQGGNIFQGRYNPWLDSTDVQGAHATSANAKSVGISLLGNFSASAGGIPDLRALHSLSQLIAWRFDQRTLDPLESASIATNLGGPRVLPRICGHRDVGSTECPGVNLYVQLPMIQSDVKALLAANGISGNELPGGFDLYQNFPNPFNSATMISYRLPVAGEVRLSVYDLLGREVALLVNEVQAPGTYDEMFDATGLASGIYICRLTTGRLVESQKLVLLR